MGLRPRHCCNNALSDVPNCCDGPGSSLLAKGALPVLISLCSGSLRWLGARCSRLDWPLTLLLMFQSLFTERLVRSFQWVVTALSLSLSLGLVIFVLGEPLVR